MKAPASRPRRILAADTTSARESVALIEDGRILGEVRLQAADGHSRRLLPAIEFLLSSTGTERGGLHGFAVTTGPGSFTGLRVGLSTIQGLALATGAPCVGVSALDVLARRMAGAAPRLVPMVDAYRDQVYASVHDVAGTRLEGPFAAAPLDVLARVKGPAALLGDGADRYREALERARPDGTFPARSLWLASTLALMAEPLFEQGRTVSARDLRPLYLREADIRPSSS